MNICHRNSQIQMFPEDNYSTGEEGDHKQVWIWGFFLKIIYLEILGYSSTKQGQHYLALV